MVVVVVVVVFVVSLGLDVAISTSAVAVLTLKETCDRIYLVASFSLFVYISAPILRIVQCINALHGSYGPLDALVARAAAQAGTSCSAASAALRSGFRHAIHRAVAWCALRAHKGIFC